jgi:hypothetical protein
VPTFKLEFLRTPRTNDEDIRHRCSQQLPARRRTTR